MDYKVCDIVKIYEKPLTREKFEGEAIVRRVLGDDTYSVSFPDYPKEEFVRKIMYRN